MAVSSDTLTAGSIVATSLPAQAVAKTPMAPAATGCCDADVARTLCPKDGQVLVVANAYTVCVFTRATTGDAWHPSCAGEFASESLLAAKALIKRGRLFWGPTSGLPSTADPQSLKVEVATTQGVQTWLKQADSVSLRQGEASRSTRERVAYLAAWRCQFPGCGCNLRSHPSTKEFGQYSYFAHIVASSPDGPRGQSIDSKLLADDPDNFLLLCDACHRLIDRVSPDVFTVEVLQDIRERSIAEVETLLGHLQYPEVQPISIIGNIGGQVAQFSVDDANRALWDSNLRSGTNQVQSFFVAGGQHHDPHSTDYWPSLFRTLTLDIPRLQSLLNGTSRGGRPRPSLAVFPLHGTSVLILAGRILGDNPGTFLFQPHRDKVGELTKNRWAWPKDAVKPASDKYRVIVRHDHTGNEREACLVISLTFSFEPSRLPERFRGADAYALPTLEIVVDHPSAAVIQTPQDLDLLGLRIDDALRKLQDEWGVTHIHLFVGAPTSATVVVGQKMQARNQATFTCYEAAGGAGSEFRPTIAISSSQVRELVSGRAIPLQP